MSVAPRAAPAIPNPKFAMRGVRRETVHFSLLPEAGKVCEYKYASYAGLLHANRETGIVRYKILGFDAYAKQPSRDVIVITRTQNRFRDEGRDVYLMKLQPGAVRHLCQICICSKGGSRHISHERAGETYTEHC